jgi:hypothetical protein
LIHSSEADVHAVALPLGVGRDEQVGKQGEAHLALVGISAIACKPKWFLKLT